MILDVQSLRKHYVGKDKKPFIAVDDVSLQLVAGEVLAFLGPNGAGKTTSIKMIAGLIQPDDGDAFICGHSIKKHSRKAISHVGAVLEGSRNLYWRLTPLENLIYWAGLKGYPHRIAKERAMDLLSNFGLQDKAHDTLQKLSRGMQQQVAICAALMHSPSLLLLDEPTLGLDLQAADRIQELIIRLAKEEHVGILLTTHQMEVAQTLADRVCIVRKGRVVLEGHTHDVLEQFSENKYIFELGEPLTHSQRQIISERGADFVDEKTFYISITTQKELYDILRTTEPCSLLRMERDLADLASVFRHYVE